MNHNPDLVNARKTNPIRAIYLAQEKSLSKIAKENDLTVSFIQRAMEGAFPSLPVSVGETFADLSEFTRPQLEDRYKNYIEDTWEVTIPPKVELDMGSSIKDWKRYRSILCRLNGFDDSRLAAAGLLHVNVNVIANWENGITRHFPMQIIEFSKRLGAPL